ncbi:choloylglycine hydrolase, partial [Francisella tularensis subsp. holarctica]|nr:choloylglycine hydrolase [Francisella tularensis subsp. holarctica]
MNKIIPRVRLTGGISSRASATFACSEFNQNFDGDLGVYTTIT